MCNLAVSLQPVRGRPNCRLLQVLRASTEVALQDTSYTSRSSIASASRSSPPPLSESSGTIIGHPFDLAYNVGDLDAVKQSLTLVPKKENTYGGHNRPGKVRRVVPTTYKVHYR